MDAKTWLMVAQLAFSVGLAIFTYLAARNRAKTEEVRTLSDRVLVLEEAMSHLPDQDMVHALAGEMKGLQVELKGVKEALSPLVKNVDRIYDYLLNHKERS